MARFTARLEPIEGGTFVVIPAEVVDALEARGLVERAPDPDDRRATLVRPTSAADAELAGVDRVRREESERFLAVLSERDRRTLDRILRILVDQ